MLSITDRVLAYSKEHPTRMGYTYYWGDWSFAGAEKMGLIKMDDSGRYPVVSQTSCQNPEDSA